ncbi:integral membrane protein PTH11 [Fusarium heterosporum]|uniref:Integral membrane protein PTH11 n=1 Tax=Fusarium heterosporum TaxID=42747 RepID=A0A8H5TAK1_FUSHE|nr:integral membrane protein PTH11 [Fusarium heterosporum]
MPPFPTVNGVTVAVLPPEGYVVDFDHPQRRYYMESYVVSGIGITLAFLFVLQYLYVKLWVLRKPDGETACLVTAWLFSLGVQCVSLSSFIIGATGVHSWEMPIKTLKDGNKVGYIPHKPWTLLTISPKLTFNSPILYAVCTAFSKIALTLFYRRLSPQPWWRWSVYGVLFLVAGYNLAILLVIVFGCFPFEKSWDFTVLEGSCVDRSAVYICTAALGIGTDLILLLMPLPMILRLQMPRRQKAGLVVLFAIGSATLVTSVVRLVLLVPVVDAYDYTWALSSAIIWIYVEANLLIICASLTTLRRFFLHISPKFIGERGSSAGYGGASYRGTRQHPFLTLGGAAKKARKAKLQRGMESPGFDLETIVQAQPVQTQITTHEADEQPQEMIRQLRRQESINKFGRPLVETQQWDPRKDSISDDEERAIVQTTTVTVVYGPRNGGNGGNGNAN